MAEDSPLVADSIVKIAIVDDHTLVREALAFACGSLWSTAEVKTAASGAVGLALCSQLQPHIVFFDLSLPDGHGLPLVPEIHRASPQTKIIALTTFADEFTVHHALRINLSGVITKREQSLERLKDVVDIVLAGGQYFSPAFELVRDALRSDPRSFDKLLSAHEQNLLVLFGAGMSNRDVADKLHLSINTVQVHRRNILAKLGMHSTPELMNYALAKGFRFADR